MEWAVKKKKTEKGFSTKMNVFPFTITQFFTVTTACNIVNFVLNSVPPVLEDLRLPSIKPLKTNQKSMKEHR